MSSRGLKATAEELGPVGCKNGRALLFFTKQIAYPNDGIDLFLCESRQQIPPD
jgi:hypothetical protein